MQAGRRITLAPRRRIQANPGSRLRPWFAWLFVLASAVTASASASSAPVLFEWERGFGLRVPGEPAAEMFLWFYEWNMFEAMKAGEHTNGTHHLDRKLNASGTEAVIDSPALHLTMRAVKTGAQLELRVTNRTEYTWPQIAGIIPCWNPGQIAGTPPQPLNRNFSDPTRTRTFFLSADGLTPLTSCAIHFNARYRSMVDAAATAGKFVFSSKWPTSEINSAAGLLIRESEDGQWVTGIAWEDPLSVQGHNPWYCMHAGIRVGGLKPNETRVIRGRLYLLRGTKEQLAAQFRKDFPASR